MARARTLVALTAAACIATACTSGAPVSRTQPSTQPSASASPSGATLPAGTRELPAGEGAALAAGSYTKPDFLPRLSFRVDRGWHAGHDLAGFFDVQRRPNTPDAIAVQFALVFSAATPAAAIRELRETVDLRVTDRGQTTIGGHAAHQILIDSRDPHLTPARYTAIFSVASGSLYIGSGRRLLVDLVRFPGSLVAVLVSGSVRSWPAAIRAAGPVVDSIRFL
jgi:hypothetical protein